MTGSLDNDEIIARLQQREKEQSQLIAMNEHLACSTTRTELACVLNTVVKNITGFAQVMICIEDETKKIYTLFYHDDPSEYTRYKAENFKESLDVFNAVLNSPEPILLSQGDLAKTGDTLLFILNASQDFTGSIVGSTLMSKYYKGVLFLSFAKENIPQNKGLHLIKMLSLQLGITLTNILLLEKTLDSSLFGSDTRPPEKVEEPDKMKIIGESLSIQKVRSFIKLVSNTDSSVLIQGESGTGKEIVANALHYSSARRNGPLIKVNCAAIPKNLIESELFGHEKGSFTGAIARKTGKFEQAHSGTLLLDDINEMPLELQVKLLRVLQEKEIQRIGSANNIKIDTRIIASTNTSLEEEVRRGTFRADLFYRLNVFPIDVPPLRERRDDIVGLASFFVQRYCEKNKWPVKTIAAKALTTLEQYAWPGNVRELEHVIERSVLLSPDKVIKDIATNIQKQATSPSGTAVMKPLNEFEKEYILSVLEFCKGKISGPCGAASILQIPATTLHSKMEKLGIQKRHFFTNK